MTGGDYETINKALWDERGPVHAKSADYKFQQYSSDPSYIGDVVTFDRPLLGDIAGLDCVHLQCHIGTDTLSLARLGAASVTGLDFSPKSLLEARNLAKLTEGTGGEKLKFVEASVYDGLKVLPAAKFDLVFTGIGALCWIPEVGPWAKVVAGLLKPGGRFFIREGHPILWALDDQASTLAFKYPYFESKAPTISDVNGTYVESGDYEFNADKSAEFNHGMGEIVQALLEAGLKITGFVEHRSVPWMAIPHLMQEEQNECSLKEDSWKLPLSYTIQAIKET